MDESLNNRRPGYFIAALTVSLGFIISAALGSYTFYTVKNLDNALSVTGSAKKQITSDSVKWRTSLSRQTTADDLQAGYKQLAEDLNAAQTWLKVNGLTDKDLEISPVYMNEVYKNYAYAGPKEYSLRQTIIVQSNEVNKVSDLAKNTQELINKGILFATDSLEYYSSEVPKLRVELLAEAVKDAKARAIELAESNGQKVGNLKQAASGVVQVLSTNSADISDYGAYDTSSIDKEIMVTVRATFNLR